MITRKQKRYIRVTEVMIEKYCRDHHGKKLAECSDCSSLFEFCSKRIVGCRYGDAKPPCSSCRTHCYKPSMRSAIKSVMKYSGPKMLFSHPFIVISHALATLKWKFSKSQ